MLKIIVNSDAVTELFSKLYGAAAEKGTEVVAEAAAELTRTHIDGIAGKRHRSRSPRNYYAEAAASVIREWDDNTATVSIPHAGFALRYYGGTVRPSGRTSLITGKPIRRLAIPISGSPAEGKTPGDFKDIFFLKSKKGNGLLAQDKGNGLISVLFSLHDKTEHEEDKSILPTDAEYDAAVVKAIETLIEEQDR